MSELANAGKSTTFRIDEANDRSGGSVIIGARSTNKIASRVFLFDCPDVPALFERLFALRKEMTGRTALSHQLPFSAAFAQHEQRANARWVAKPGFLAVGARDCAYRTWQTGWCGGLMSTLPLLAAGDKTSRERAA